MATTAVWHTDKRSMASLIQTGGDANKYVNRRMEMMKTRAIATAPLGPPRNGENHRFANLKRSHFRNGLRMEGSMRAVGSLINNARYAKYVHEGVGGKIYPRGSFRIPKTSWVYYTGGAGSTYWHWGKGTHLRRDRPVNGQKANPWLADAVAAVMREMG